jgi:hypothetical protein
MHKRSALTNGFHLGCGEGDRTALTPSCEILSSSRAPPLKEATTAGLPHSATPGNPLCIVSVRRGHPTGDVRPFSAEGSKALEKTTSRVV